MAVRSIPRRPAFPRVATMRPLFPSPPPLGTALLAWAVAVAVPAAATAPSDEEIAGLIAALGDDDFAVRETAAAKLAEVGAVASDALLSAAESSDDLEIALKARWLVEALPLATADDPPEVAALLDRFSRSDYDARVQLMHRLLRLDDDAGIEPLARIVRLERTATGSRIAAALLAREWQPGDPAWPGIAARIIAGLGPSSRPAAGFLRGLVKATTADATEAGKAVDAAVAAVAALARPAESERRMADVEDATDTLLGDSKTLRIFRRCLVQLLARAGRRSDGLAEAGRLFAACRGMANADDLVAAELVWLADHGLPEAVDLLADDLAADKTVDPLVAYATAVAQRRRGDEPAATATAMRANAALGGADVDLSRRLQAAILLARWGAADWALREYEALTGDPQAPVGEFALAGILGAEFLHDQGRDADAADVLRRVLEGRGDGEAMDQILMRLERDPRSVRSRMLYFAASAAGARGDEATQRRLLDEALRCYGKDVDALIAVHALAGDDPDRLADAKARVTRALEQIDEEIQAVPDDPNGYNEYAWLVANTAGDIRKATRYSKRSLEHSFDSASYLDTLAHCRAAAGDLAGAVRTQALAARQEPHNGTIRRNLERFARMAAAR